MSFICMIGSRSRAEMLLNVRQPEKSVLASVGIISPHVVAPSVQRKFVAGLEHARTRRSMLRRFGLDEGVQVEQKFSSWRRKILYRARARGIIPNSARACYRHI